MSANRTSGGIYGSSGKNVNPSKEFTEQRTAKAKYGADSKQYKEANRQVKGAVLQARRYDSNGNQIK
jgi:hypothetical protein